MARKVKHSSEASHDQSAADELRTDWLLRPLHSPPTDDKRTREYLSEVGAEAEDILRALKGRSGTERLDAIRELLKARPLPAEKGFSRVHTVYSWADKFRRSAERAWTREYAKREAALTEKGASVELDWLRSVGPMSGDDQ